MVNNIQKIGILEANSLLHTKQIAILQAKVKALEELLAKEALK